MAAFLLAFVTGLLGAPQEEEKEKKPKPGEYRVNVYGAVFNAEPSALSDVLRKANRGERVNVVEFIRKGNMYWAKCDFGEGKFGYISSKSILNKKDYKDQSEGSEEEGSAKAEGYRGSRFDPKTEDEYSKGKNLGAAYGKVDEWCGRPEVKDEGKTVKHAMPGKPAWKNDRATMLMELRKFRRDGKLGEFSGD